MENKLIPMTDFCLNLLNQNPPYNEVKMLTQISNYANFLKQLLTLGMFVPVDEKGNVLEEPKSCDRSCSPSDWNDTGKCKECRQEYLIYKKAKEKVLFEGYSKEFNAIRSPEGGYLDTEGLKGKTIETIIGSNLELTPTALKYIGI